MRRIISSYLLELVGMVLIIVGFLLYFYFRNFAESNFFVALTTFLVGLFAYYVYKQQKRDLKKDAANILLMEIRQIEDSIEKLKSGVPADLVKIPNNSWEKYTYLFIQDLDDHLDQIDNFFSQSTMLGNLFTQLALSSQLHQKSQAIYDGLTRLAIKSAEENKDYTDLRKKFIDNIDPDDYRFKPKFSVSSAVKILADIKTISNTPAYEKLKKISK